MIKYPKSQHILAEKCLNKYWNSFATDYYGGGWDKGSPAHKTILKWIEQNYKRFKTMTFREIYKEYVEQRLRQD